MSTENASSETESAQLPESTLEASEFIGLGENPFGNLEDPDGGARVKPVEPDETSDDDLASLEQFQWIADEATPWTLGDDGPIWEAAGESSETAEPDTTPIPGEDDLREYLALEIRAERIREVVLGNAHRSASHDEIWLGSDSESYDYVRGKETIAVEGRLREHTGWGHSTTATEVHTHIKGNMDVRAEHEDSIILAGTMTDVWNCGTFIGAVMSDDLCAGAGARVTAPADMWLHGLMGMEERPGTATADGIFAELYGTHFEREYGIGSHYTAVATFNGGIFQTQATGFRPLLNLALGVRNLIPGGGGGAGESSVGPPPGGGAAAAGTAVAAASAVKTGTEVTETVTNADNMLAVVRASEELENLSEIENAHHAADTAQTMQQLQDAMQTVENVAPLEDAIQVADEGATLGRAATETSENVGDAVQNASRDDIYTAITATQALAEPVHATANQQGVVEVSEHVFRSITEGIIELEVDDYWGGPLNVGEYTLKVEGFEMIDGKLTNVVTGEVLDLEDLGTGLRAADADVPPPLPPGREFLDTADAVPPREQFGLDQPTFSESRDVLQKNYMEYRGDLKWNGVLAYGDALDGFDDEVMYLFRQFGGEVEELADAGKPTTDAAYDALRNMVWQLEEAGQVEEAAQVRQAIEALDERIANMVEDLASQSIYFDARGIPGTTGLQPELDQAKLLDYMAQQKAAAQKVLESAADSGDAALIQEASYTLDYWTQMEECLKRNESPMAYSSGMIAYLDHMGQEDQVTLFLNLQEVLIDVLSDPDYLRAADDLEGLTTVLNSAPTSVLDSPSLSGVDEAVQSTQSAPGGTLLDTGELPPLDTPLNNGALDGNGQWGGPAPTQGPEWSSEVEVGAEGAHWKAQSPEQIDPAAYWDAGSSAVQSLETTVRAADETQPLEETRQLQNGVPLANQLDESLPGTSWTSPPEVPERAWPADRPPHSFGFSADDPSAPAWIKDDYKIERTLAAGDIPPGFTSRDELLETWQRYAEECTDGGLYGRHQAEMRDFGDFIESMGRLVDDDTNPTAQLREAIAALRRQAAEAGPDSAAYWKLTMAETMFADLNNALAADFGYRANFMWVDATDALIELSRSENASQADVARQQDAVWALFEQYSLVDVPQRPPQWLGGSATVPPPIPPRPGTSSPGYPMVDPTLTTIVETAEGPEVVFLGRQAQDAPPVPPRLGGSPPVPPRPGAPPVPPRRTEILNLEDARLAYNVELGPKDGAHLPDFAHVDLPSFWAEIDEADRPDYIRLAIAKAQMQALAQGDVHRHMEDFVSNADEIWRTTFRDEILPQKYPELIGTPRAEKLENLYGQALAANQVWSQIDFTGSGYLEDTASSSRSFELGDSRQAQNASVGGKAKKSVRFGDAEAILIQADEFMVTDEAGNVFKMDNPYSEPAAIVGESDAMRIVPVPEGWQAGRTPGMGRTATEPGAFPFTTQEYLVNRLMQEGGHRVGEIGYSNIGSSMNRLTSSVEQGYSTGRISSDSTVQKLDDLLAKLKLADQAATVPGRRSVLLSMDVEMLTFLCWLTDVSRRAY